MSNKWIDITNEIQESINILNNINPMVNSENFSLLESMSATELMDPKMDNSYGISNKSLDELKLLKPDFPVDYSMNSLVVLMKAIFCYQLAYYDGASIYESTHQCVFFWYDSWNHLMDNDCIENKILLTYIKSILKSMYHYSKLVLNVDIYEEEDFQHCNSQLLGESIDDSTVISELTNYITIVQSFRDEYQDDILFLLQSQLCLLHILTTCEDITFLSVQLYRSSDNDEDITRKQIQCTNAIYQLSILISIYNVILTKYNNLSNDEIDNKNSTNPFIDYITTNNITFAFSHTLARLNQTGPIRQIKINLFNQNLNNLINITTQLLNVMEIALYIIQNLQLNKSINIYNYANSYIVECIDSYITTTYVSRFHDIINNKLVSEYKYTFDDIFHISIYISQSQYHLLSRCMYISYLYLTFSNRFDILIKSFNYYNLPIYYYQSFYENQTLDVSIYIGQFYESFIHLIYETIKAISSTSNKIISRLESVFIAWGNVITEGSYIDKIIHDYILTINNNNDIKLSNSTDSQAIANEDSNIESFKYLSTNLQNYLVYYTTKLVTQLIDYCLYIYQSTSLLNIYEYDLHYWMWEYIVNSHTRSYDRLFQCIYEYQVNRYNHLYMLEKDKQLNIYNQSISNKNSNIIKKNKNKSKSKAIVLQGNDLDLYIHKQILESFAKSSIEIPFTHSTTVYEYYIRGVSSLYKAIYRCYYVYVSILSHSFKRSTSLSSVINNINKYSSISNLFSHRYKLFEPVPSPSMLTYNEFLGIVSYYHYHPVVSENSSINNENSNNDETSNENPTDLLSTIPNDPINILKSAQSHYQFIKKFIDEIKKNPVNTCISDKYARDNIMALAKASIANSINCTRVMQALESYKIDEKENTSVIDTSTYPILEFMGSDDQIIRYRIPVKDINVSNEAVQMKGSNSHFPILNLQFIE